MCIRDSNARLPLPEQGRRAQSTAGRACPCRAASVSSRARTARPRVGPSERDGAVGLPAPRPSGSTHRSISRPPFLALLPPRPARLVAFVRFPKRTWTQRRLQRLDEGGVSHKVPANGHIRVLGVDAGEYVLTT